MGHHESALAERETHHMRPTPHASADERTSQPSALNLIRSWLHAAAAVVRNGTYGPRRAQSSLRGVGQNRPYGPRMTIRLAMEVTR